MTFCNPTAADFAYYTDLTIADSKQIMEDAKDGAIKFETVQGDFRVTAEFGILVLIKIDYTEEETQYTV